MSIVYPYKAKTKIKVLSRITGKYEEEEVEALFFSPENSSFMIMQDEIYRLAEKHSVKITDLVDCGCTSDIPFFHSYNYNSTPPKEPWNKLVRFYATYKIVDSAGNIFFGSGSAGHDNIGTWVFKGSAYDVAHKRAKVTGIRHALGLFEYKIEGMEAEELKGVQEPASTQVVYSSAKLEDTNEKPTNIQLTSFVNIMKRLLKTDISIRSLVEQKKIPSENHYIEFLRIIDMNINEENDTLLDTLMGYVSDKLSKKEVAVMIESIGDFSTGVLRPK